jgi:heme/copper-type cytochrome/quinol oxidase subunit 4
VLTIVEFVVAILTQAWWLLVIAALAKALVVLYNFMHLSRVLSDDGGHE